MMHHARWFSSTRNAHLHPVLEAKRTHLFDDLRDSFEKHHLRESKNAAEREQREMREQKQIQSQRIREEREAHQQQGLKNLFGKKRKRVDM